MSVVGVRLLRAYWRMAIVAAQATAPWIPLWASVVTIAALFLLQDPLWAVAVGVAGGLVLWVAHAAFSAGFGHPANAYPRAFSELAERVRTLEAKLESSAQSDASSTAWRTAEQHVGWLRRRLPECGKASVGDHDSGWIAGTSYIDAWNAVHRAEEAMLELASTDQLRAAALRDQLRLAESPIGNALSSTLEGVTRTLREHASDNRTSPTIAAVVPTFREVRRAINEYRDRRLDGLVRARNRLTRTTMMTAWTGYLLLVLAVALGAGSRSIGSAALYFLVGALIGLFARLRADARLDEAIEDYGLTGARLRQAALVSGLAGIAGVVLAGLTVDVSLATQEPARSVLGQIFDVESKPGGLLIAAVFGLSPYLLLSRLAAQAEQYKTDLTQTETGHRARVPASRPT
jgi:hypothetical protein